MRSCSRRCTRGNRLCKRSISKGVTPMTTLRSILLAATALATLAPPAHAASEMLRETTVESWQIQSWSRNDGPGFSFCTAHTAYSNGTYLYFQLQPSGVSGLLVALYN